MRRSRKFWQDVNFAIRTLMLRQSLQQIIHEGRKVSRANRLPDKSCPAISNRDLILFRYYEFRLSRYRFFKNYGIS